MKILLLGALGAGIFLRLYSLGKFSLWYDELITAQWGYIDLSTFAYNAGCSQIKTMLSYLRIDQQPPLYYLLIYLWSIVFGETAYALRIFSVIMNILAGIVFFKFARLFVEKNTTICAVLLFVFSPMQMWYAQEARTYSLSVFLGILMMYFYIRALRENKPLMWKRYLFTGILSIYSNYFLIFLILSFAVPLLLKENRRYFKKWLLYTIVIFLFFMPYLYIFVTQFKSIIGFSWIASPGPKSILITLTNFVIGYNNNPVQYFIFAPFLISLFLYGLFKFGRNKSAILTLSTFLFFPLVASYLFSKLITNIYLDRAFLPFSFLFYLFVANGVMNIDKKVFRIPICLFLVFGISAGSVNYYKGYFPGDRDQEIYHMGVHKKRDYSKALRFIAENISSGDVLACADMQANLIIGVHFRPYKYPSKITRHIRVFIPKYNKMPLWIVRRLNHLKNGEWLPISDYEDKETLHFVEFRKVKVGEVKEGRFRRIWLISSFWDDGWGIEADASAAREYLKEKYKVICSLHRENMFIELYEFIETGEKKASEK
ncbi:MAG: glycosyltransferase family 39 protein [Candidatus Omnitrophica bacterium]|nr:glycosyltransferase family 39 protein [Candidatus Omnitrophota bacterium]